ncbi:MAG: hypothetical protein K8I01_10605 [Candidatus Methylomirabilis sp.]|nr:hypothetical protein [Deltaproteobacteria bacterium]
MKNNKGFCKLLSLFCLTIFLLTGCGGGGNDSSQASAKLASNAKALDQNTTENLASVSEDGALLIFSGTTSQIESLQIGDVIISGIATETPGGLLRKVESIYTAPDGTVQVTTSEAMLTDAFEELRIKGTVTSDAGAAAFTRSASIDLIPKITYKIPGTNLGISGDIDATMSGDYTYSPMLDYDIDIGLRNQKLKFILRGPATLDMDVAVNAMAGVSINNNVPLSALPIYIGVVSIPIPVPPFAIVITFEFIPSVGIVFSGENTFDKTYGFRSSATIEAGLDYENGNTTLVSSFEDYNYTPYSHDGWAGIGSAKLYFSPKIGMYIYGVAGPYFDPRPYGKFSSLYSSSGNHVEAGVGISGNIGGELKFLTKSLAGINLEIADIYYRLWASEDTGPPSMPTDLTAMAASVSRIDLSWTASTDDVGVAGYMIYRGGTLIDTTTNTTASDTALSPSTSYCYSVSAIDAAGNESIYSSTVCATTLSAPDESAPTIPTGLTATAVSSSIYLSWAASSDNVGVAGYRVFRNGAQIGTSTTTSYADTMLPFGEYCYTVRAYDAAGNASQSSLSICTTLSPQTLTAINAGFWHSIALKLDGTVWSWGYNFNGELGNGTNADSNIPVQASGLTGVAAIAGGNRYTIALMADGTVWAWGDNYIGQLGNGTNADSNIPVQVSGLTGVTAIAGGNTHTIALKSDGTVWTWGQNGHGQLGNGTNADSYIPVQVSGLTGVTAIAAGSDHTIALKSDGTVWTWGYNFNGELGNGTNVSSSIPVQVSGLTGVTAIAGGYNQTIALKSDGTLWTWGVSFYGLGNGTDVSSSIPVQVSGLTGVAAIARGYDHTIALKVDGTVWSWGGNGHGQLGNGTDVSSSIPVQVSGFTGVTAIAAGYHHTIALKSDGTLWAWGANYFGQLGNGTDVGSNIPVQVNEF